MFSAWAHTESRGRELLCHDVQCMALCVRHKAGCPTQWPSIKPLRILAPTNGQQGGTWQVFRASSASCSGQVQASESTTEIMNVFFHFRNMHSKCSFMVTVSTSNASFSNIVWFMPQLHFQKCISLKNSSVYALTQMCFFTSGKKIKCIFSNIVKLMSRRNPFFHFQKCILNALFMVTVSTSNAFFQILFGACFNSNVFFSLPQMHSKCSFMATTSTFKRVIVSQCSFAHIRTRARARTRAYRTTVAKDTMDIPHLFLRTFENF